MGMICKHEGLAAIVLVAVVGIASPSRAEVEHAFIVVIDGIRASEGFDDPQHELIAELVEQLAPQGSLLTHMEVRGQTLTLPAHQVAITGTYADYGNFGPYEGRENFAPRTPTLFDIYRRETGAPLESCWVVSNTYLVGPDADHSLMPGYSSDGGAANIVDWSYTLEDSWVWGRIESTLGDHEVALMLVNLHEVDRIGHTEDWDGYTEKIREASGTVTAFWERLQADPVYAGNTALFVTTDHGRHLDGISTGWRSHGCQCQGCRQVFLLALGPGIREGYASDEPCSFLDLAPTVAHLMDLPMPYHRGRVLTEILEDGDTVVRGPGGAFLPNAVRAGERVVRTYEWQDPALNDDEGAHRVVVDVSDDGGETWTTTMLEGGSAIQHAPLAWTDGDVVIAGWLEVMAGGEDWFVRLRRLAPGATEWQEVFYEPMIGSSTPIGNLVLVADEDTLTLLENNTLNERLRWWVSEDDGVSWSGEEQQWGNPRYFPRDMQHVNVGDAWLVVYSAHATGSPAMVDPNDNTEIYYARSDDAGESWDAELAISGSAAPSIQPRAVMSDDGIVHVVWSDMEDGTFQLFHAESTDEGVTFSVPVQLTFGSLGAWEPAVAIDGDRLTVAWSQFDVVDDASVHVATLVGDSLLDEQVVSEPGQVARTPHLLTMDDCTSLVTWSHSDLAGPWELAEARVETAARPAGEATGSLDPTEVEAGIDFDLSVSIDAIVEAGDRGVAHVEVRVPCASLDEAGAQLEVDGDPVGGVASFDGESLWFDLEETLTAGGMVVLRVPATADDQPIVDAPVTVVLHSDIGPCSTEVLGPMSLTVVPLAGDDDTSPPAPDDDGGGDCQCRFGDRRAAIPAALIALAAVLWHRRR